MLLTIRSSRDVDPELDEWCREHIGMDVAELLDWLFRDRDKEKSPAVAAADDSRERSTHHYEGL